MPSNFEANGCTWFPQEWRNINIRPCCDTHDEAFYFGDGVWEFIVGNFNLAVCFFNVGVWELVVPAFIATCTVGAVFYWFGKKAVTPKGNDKDTPA